MEKNIEKLKLNEELIKLLKKNKINKIKQLSNKTKAQLKEIEIKLQLEGFDLKGNH